MPKSELKAGEKLMFNTQSLCPECLKLIPMTVFEKDGKMLLRKTCEKHGTIEDVYWADAEQFRRAQKWDTKGYTQENPFVDKKNPSCPHDCGLCSLHTSHTALTNLAVTNRCDLCCWYCFFFAEKAGYIYEPTIEEMRQMLIPIVSEKPMKGNAIQLTGGNPELREDLVDIIKMIKSLGIDHVQLNVNGTHRMYKDLEFCKSLRAAGVNTIYLSFDGVTPQTNPKNHWEIPGILDNCRKSGIGIVLVPTVINGVNDHEVGKVIDFAFKHNDVVRGVNFQPVSLVGRMPRKEREKHRITIPDVIARLDKHSKGQVTKDAFYSVPCATVFSRFVESLKGRPKYEFPVHPACGVATYIFKDGNRLVPITDFVDVDGVFDYLKQATEDIKSGKPKAIVLGKLLLKLNSFVDKSRQPKSLNFGKMLLDVLVKSDYRSLSRFHHNALFVGMMHFQDLYNWDIERVKRCSIHYATQKGVIPFCTFNVIPEWYRDKIQKEYSISIPEWEKKTGKKLQAGYYKRDIKALEADPRYWKTYEGFVPKPAK